MRPLDSEEGSTEVMRKTKSVVGAGRGVALGTGEEVGDGVADGEEKNGFNENREVELFRAAVASFGGGNGSSVYFGLATTGFPHIEHPISAGWAPAYSFPARRVLMLTGSMMSSPLRIA